MYCTIVHLHIYLPVRMYCIQAIKSHWLLYLCIVQYVQCTQSVHGLYCTVCCRSSLFQWELSLYNLFCFVNYCTILYVNYSTYINCSLFKQSSNSGTPHCPKNNLNLCLKTEPVTVGADATLHMWLVSGPDILYTVQYVTKWRTSTVAFAPAVTGSVFMRDLN